MGDPESLGSEAFRVFLREAPEQARAWGAMVGRVAEASALDRKTAALAYLKRQKMKERELSLVHRG